MVVVTAALVGVNAAFLAVTTVLLLLLLYVNCFASVATCTGCLTSSVSRVLLVAERQQCCPGQQLHVQPFCALRQGCGVDLHEL